MSSSAPSKCATIFLIDVSPTMLHSLHSRESSSNSQNTPNLDLGHNPGSNLGHTPNDTPEDVTRLTSAVRVVQVLLSSQLLLSKRHQSAIILIGTSVAKNPLAAEARATVGSDGSYGNCVVLRDLAEGGRGLEELERVVKRQGYWEGDFWEEHRAAVYPFGEGEVKTTATSRAKVAS